jgi:hypothetical protein
VAFPGSFDCPVYRDTASLMAVAADPAVLQFVGCGCEVRAQADTKMRLLTLVVQRGFFGSPRFGCAACLPGAQCDGG